MDYLIRKIKAREILDSRGNPTIEVEVSSKTHTAREEVPSGASTGIHEALELRDDDKHRYTGKGVRKAVDNVNNIIARKIIGIDCREQRFIDDLLVFIDGTPNKSRLGANAALGVSLACMRLSAMIQGKPLHQAIHEYAMKSNKVKLKKNIIPLPFMNVINGGKHADNRLKVQEFMIVPRGKNFADSLRIGAEVYHELKKQIEKKYGKSAANVGDEGGFAPNINHSEEALDLLTQTVRKLGYQNKVRFAMDVAASEFYNPNTKKYDVDGKHYDYSHFIDYYEKLIKKYNLISIEDPFAQDHFEPFVDFTKEFGRKIQIVGDDLTVTNSQRVKMAIVQKMCNALLLKVNQIGTLSEAIDAAKLAMSSKWNVMVSHRSGETSSSFIADLAVALGCGQIKAGAPCRSERLAKYNQLLRIEEELGKKAKLARWPR